MQTKNFFIKLFNEVHEPTTKARAFLKYLGTGVLVTVGFIDPGNWASNLAAGSQFGYNLLWVITLSTVILIILQHNAARLGIISGRCLSEASKVYLNQYISVPILISAMIAVISTAFAEILGGGIALSMLFHIPIKIGALFTTILCFWLLSNNTYSKLEKLIIGFVSVIGFSFLYELIIAHANWGLAIKDTFIPNFPHGSFVVIMAVVGAVVMPHNLFLHSEIVHNKEWSLEGKKVVEQKLKYSFMDTMFSMIIGWGINCAIIIVATCAFYYHKINVVELQQASLMLKPIFGNLATIIFAVALLFSGVAATITAGIAGGSIFAGFFDEIYDINDFHSKIGAYITYILAFLTVLITTNTFKALIYSQILLSLQLPITIILQLYLTSSKKVMGNYANNKITNIILWSISAIVIILNLIMVKEALNIH